MNMEKLCDRSAEKLLFLQKIFANRMEAHIMSVQRYGTRHATTQRVEKQKHTAFCYREGAIELLAELLRTDVRPIRRLVVAAFENGDNPIQLSGRLRDLADEGEDHED